MVPSLPDVQTKGHFWMHGYNTTHAHSALGYLTPEEFLATYETTQLPQESVAA
jgi:transposase InsO family protein